MLCACPFDPGEMPGKMSTLVREPVPLLRRQIPSPLADFDVSLKERSMNNGSCILIPYAGFLLHTSWGLFKWTVGNNLSFAQRLSGVIWNIGRGKFNLRLLLLGQVCRGPVGRERIKKVLFVLLIDDGWKRSKGGENMVAYGESSLGRWCERSRQSDTVELGRTRQPA